MPTFICTACVTQHAATVAPPSRCVVCEDARQSVPPTGKRALAPFDYDTIYGHFFDRVIAGDAKEVVRVSVERCLAAIAANP